MKYKLVYPTSIAEVSIMPLTGKVLKALASAETRNSGQSIVKLLQLIINEEQVANISVIDARQIIGLSWSLTYNSDVFNVDVKCKCGSWHAFKHDVCYNISPNKKLFDEININGYIARLNSPTVQRDVDLALVDPDNIKEEELLDIAWNNTVKYVKLDDEIVSFDDLPLNIISQINTLLDEENAAINKMTTQKRKCKCGEQVVSIFNIMEQDFLAPKSLR